MDALLPLLTPEVVGSLLTGSAAALIFIWVRHRTRSNYAFLLFLWKKAAGERPSTSEAVQRFYEEQYRIHEFRFKTGIYAPTVTSVSSAIRFATTHDVDIELVARCGLYFDVHKGKLLLDRPKILVALNFVAYVSCAGLATLSLFLVGMLMSDKILLRFSDSGTYFTLNETVAKPLTGRGFELSRCAPTPRETIAGTGFLENEIDLLCAEHEGGRWPKQLMEERADQRFLAGLFMVPVTIFAVVLFYLLSAYAAAVRLEKIIYTRARERARCYACGALE